MKTKEFVDVLKKVLPGVDDKQALLEGANSFLFDGDWVKTFNDNISVSYPYKTDLKCLVRASEFYKILSKIDSETVKMVQLEDNKIQVMAGKTSLKMNAFSDVSQISSLVDNLSLEKIEWMKLPAEFLEGLRFCAHFAAHSSVYPNLLGISVAKDGLISTDNFRAAWFHIKVKTKDPFTIPIGAVMDILSGCTPTEFSVGEAWIHFRDKDGLCFSVRKMAIDFPREAIKKLLGADGLYEGKKHIFPEEIKASLDRAAVLSSVDSNGSEFVEVFLDKKGSLIVSGKREFGEIQEKISKSDKWTFPEGAILSLNPKLFASLLSVSNDFYMSENKRYLAIRAGELDCIMALVKRED